MWDVPRATFMRHLVEIRVGKNKNFRAQGEVKIEIPHFWLDRTLFSYSHRRRPGRTAHNLPVNFSENRLIYKKFQISGDVRLFFAKFPPPT
jgi:hypothetical protein